MKGVAATTPMPPAPVAALTVSDLGRLGGTQSIGVDINASGQVAGYSLTAGNCSRARTTSRLFLSGRALRDLLDRLAAEGVL